MKHNLNINFQTIFNNIVPVSKSLKAGDLIVESRGCQFIDDIPTEPLFNDIKFIQLTAQW